MSKFLFIVSVFISQLVYSNPDSCNLKINVKKAEKTYCKPRIIGMSPNKVMSFGYDMGLKQKLESSNIGSYNKDADVDFIESTQYKQVSGMRFNAKIPIINTSKIIWQFGINYLQANYQKIEANFPTSSHYFGAEISKLTSFGLSTSIYKPIDSKQFIIVSVSSDLNGDYTFTNLHSLKYLKYSVLAMYGNKVNDKKQWAFGLARAYGAGISTILPVAMFNYTSKNTKWGAEILLPARAWYRYSINKNSLFRAGFELEGASYRLLHINSNLTNMELRKGELRTKLEYQCKLYKSIWLSAQTGYSFILNYNLDYLGNDKDFSRQFNPNLNYAMINKMTNFMFFNLSINFVSF